MTFFNSHTYKIGISATDADHYLRKLTAAPGHTNSSMKQRPYLFTGWIKKGRFELRSKFFSEIIAINGKIEPADDKNVYIHITGRLIWTPLLFNIIVLLTTASALLAVSALIIQLNFFYGILGIITSLFLTFQLYRYSIGRLKQNYDKISLEIIGLLSCVST